MLKILIKENIENAHNFSLFTKTGALLDNYINDNDGILTPELLQTLISTEHLLEILCQETASVFEKNDLKQKSSQKIKSLLKLVVAKKTKLLYQ